MPINYNTVKTALFDWVTTQVPVGMPVILYQPNAPRPTIPYVTIYLNQTTQVNQDWSAPVTDENGVMDMKGDRQFNVQLQAYGGDPLTLLENLRTSLQKQTVLDILRASGIVFYQSLAINDITALVETEFEKRAQLDISLGIGQVYTDEPGYFDEIEIEEIISDALNIVYQETITITAP